MDSRVLRPPPPTLFQGYPCLFRSPFHLWLPRCPLGPSVVNQGERDFGCSWELSRGLAPDRRLSVYSCALLPAPVGTPHLHPLPTGSVLRAVHSQLAVGCLSPSLRNERLWLRHHPNMDHHSSSGVMSALHVKEAYFLGHPPDFEVCALNHCLTLPSSSPILAI